MIDIQVDLMFKMFQQVKPKYGQDVEGVITAFCIRGKGHVTYEMSWIHDGAAKTGWFCEEELDPIENSNGMKAGFYIEEGRRGRERGDSR